MKLRHLVREIVYSPSERVPNGNMRREPVLIKINGEYHEAKDAYMNGKGEFIIEAK